MGVLRFARDRPCRTEVIQADLRRAAEYKAGRPLSEKDVRIVLDAEWDALVKRWVALGQWIARLEEADGAEIVPRAQPAGQYSWPRSALSRQRMTEAKKAYWARRKAAQKGA